MEQKDKDLLLKYLCMALPYGLICSIYRIDDWNVGWRDENLTGYFDNGTAYEFYFGKSPISIDNDISKIKPYLRPISSMTMEEDRTRIDLGIWKSNQYNGQVIGIFQDIAYANPLKFQSALIWLLQNHFDIFGLIPARLAIEVTKENNPYKIAK